MVDSKSCLEILGQSWTDGPNGEMLPNAKWERTNMVLWDVPDSLNAALPTVPNKIYCHKLMPQKLEWVFSLLASEKLSTELKTWDGCFNLRKKRGLSSPSLHSWGIAIDVNAAWNQLGNIPKLSKIFVKCFEDSGFEWGGRWQGKRMDGMHFQLGRIF